MNLSPHFTLDEMVRSAAAVRRGLPNTPDKHALKELERLCVTVLEPIRAHVGPLSITSGFRTPAVNAAVGSTAKNSAHLYGRAADFKPLERTLRATFHLIRQLPGIPFDQLILERGTWIHVGIAPLGRIPRGEALVAELVRSEWKYSPAPPLEKEI